MVAGRGVGLGRGGERSAAQCGRKTHRQHVVVAPFKMAAGSTEAFSSSACFDSGLLQPDPDKFWASDVLATASTEAFWEDGPEEIIKKKVNDLKAKFHSGRQLQIKHLPRDVTEAVSILLHKAIYGAGALPDKTEMDRSASRAKSPALEVGVTVAPGAWQRRAKSPPFFVANVSFGRGKENFRTLSRFSSVGTTRKLPMDR